MLVTFVIFFLLLKVHCLLLFLLFVTFIKKKKFIVEWLGRGGGGQGYIYIYVEGGWEGEGVDFFFVIMGS
jgi:hypothetical protein